jgi:hypothetical protein
VQVDPIKPTLKAPGNKLLKLKYDEPLLNFAFNSNLRHYDMGLVSCDAAQASFISSFTVGAYTRPR